MKVHLIDGTLELSEFKEKEGATISGDFSATLDGVRDTLSVSGDFDAKLDLLAGRAPPEVVAHPPVHHVHDDHHRPLLRVMTGRVVSVPIGLLRGCELVEASHRGVDPRPGHDGQPVDLAAVLDELEVLLTLRVGFEEVDEPEGGTVRGCRVACGGHLVLLLVPARGVLVAGLGGASLVAVGAHEGLHVVREEVDGRGDALDGVLAAVRVVEDAVAEGEVPGPVGAVAEHEDVRGSLLRIRVEISRGDGRAHAVAAGAAREPRSLRRGELGRGHRGGDRGSVVAGAPERRGGADARHEREGSVLGREVFRPCRVEALHPLGGHAEERGVRIRGPDRDGRER